PWGTSGHTCAVNGYWCYTHGGPKAICKCLTLTGGTWGVLPPGTEGMRVFGVGTSEDTDSGGASPCCNCLAHAAWAPGDVKTNIVRYVSQKLSLSRNADGTGPVTVGDRLDGPTALYAQGVGLSVNFNDAAATFSHELHPDDTQEVIFTVAGLGLAPANLSGEGFFQIPGGLGCTSLVSVITSSDLAQGSVRLDAGSGLFFSATQGDPPSAALTLLTNSPPASVNGSRDFWLGATNGGFSTLTYSLLTPSNSVCLSTNITVEAVMVKLATNSYYVAYGSTGYLEIDLDTVSHDPAGFSLYVDNTLCATGQPPWQVDTSCLTGGVHMLTVACETFPELADTAEVNVIKVEKISLGGSTNLSKFIIGKVYVPTKWGGELKLTGSNVQLFYTDGSILDGDTAIKIVKGELDTMRVAQGNPCVYEVPDYKHKWYYMKTSAAAGASVAAGFVEWGEAETTPWNGWYWPLLNTRNPNLYEETGGNTPLKDYDTVYGTNSHERAAEEANGSTSDTNAWWEGHCWGWSLAAIAIPEPQALVKNNVTFTRDEMEGLYTELADGATEGWEYKVGTPETVEPPNPIPAGPPTEATGEAVDVWADKVQNGLRQYIRQEGKAMNSNLRDATGADATEVWNHDIYKYESTMEEATGGNEKVVKVTTLVTSNTDGSIMLPATDKREDTYVYVLEYTGDGIIDGSSTNQNWISCTGFAPKWLGTVNPARMVWTARHCEITKEKVDALYQ
ncbi:MAG: hypothetical protein WCK89_21155, partial [bacterium]